MQQKRADAVGERLDFGFIGTVACRFGESGFRTGRDQFPFGNHRRREPSSREAIRREEAPIRFTAKDVLAHINAWKWRQVRVVAGDRGPVRPYEPPRLKKIRDINAAIYRRSHRTPSATIVAEHRAAHRAMLQALRDAPAAYFAKRWAAQWPVARSSRCPSCTAASTTRASNTKS